VTIPKCHAIVEAVWLLISKLQGPVLAAVYGLVDARLITGARTQQIGDIGAECFYVAEVETLGTRNLRHSPCVAVRHAQICAVSSTGPGYLFGDRADATQVLGGVGLELRNVL